MLKESAAERMLCDWLRQEGYSPHKGVDVDQEAWKDGRLKWLFEVKVTK